MLGGKAMTEKRTNNRTNKQTSRIRIGPFVNGQAYLYANLINDYN